MITSGPSTTIDGPVFPDDAAVNETAAEVFQRYLDKGPHPEYRAFEARVASGIGGRRRAPNVWVFIEDAVTGDGGFSNGSYLFPFKGEVENLKLGDKFATRMVQADYDRFPEHICNAPWDLIVSAHDMIDRKADASVEKMLGAFWQDVDNRGMSMIDFLEDPHKQARKFRTGWILIDRPAGTLRNKAEDRAPENRPYIYAVPTQNVVWWDFDDDANLVSIVVLEPPDSGDYKAGDAAPVRVWTRTDWAVYIPNKKKAKKAVDYDLAGTGPNDLGEVPAVPIWNDMPPPGRAFGESEMLEVARIAQTVYNIDSEAREIERKCALFLSMPVKDVANYDAGKAIIGTDSVMLYDGEAGEPRWISPDLTILERLDKRRESKKADAYNMAGLGALAGAIGIVQTSSGFHAEVEFSKTERRIARYAAMLESVEKRVATLFLKYMGIDVTNPDLFTITYPRDFGIRDMQKLIDDAIAILGITVGEEWERAELTKLAKARFPRKSEKDISSMVDGAVKTRSLATKQLSAVDRIRQLASSAGAPESPAGVQPGASANVDRDGADGRSDAGVSTDLTLNGAQITAAVDVMVQLRQQILVPEDAIELLVAVGIPRPKAAMIVSRTKSKPPLEAAELAKAPAPAPPAA